MRSRVWILRQNIPISLIHYWATCPVVYFNWVMSKGRRVTRRRATKEAHFLLVTMLPFFAFPYCLFSRFLMACVMFRLIFFLRHSLPFSYFLPLPPFPPIKPDIGKESDDYASVSDHRSCLPCKLIHGRNTSVHQIFTVRPLQAVISKLPLFPRNLHDR